MKKVVLLVFLFLAITLKGQKLPLDHSVYDGWKSVDQTLISNNGELTAFTINPQQGDGWLFIYNSITGKTDSVARGTSPLFSPDCKYIAYKVVPTSSGMRQAKKKKLKEDQMPKSSLEIRKLPENEITNIPEVKSFAVPAEKSYWMAYLLEKKPSEKSGNKQPADSTRISKEKVNKSTRISEPKGTDFVIFNPVLNKEYRFTDVTEYVVAKEGNSISFIQDIPDSASTGNTKVTVFNTRTEISNVVFEGKGSAKKISSDKSGNYTSFLLSLDTSKIRIFDLWLSKSFNSATRIVDTLNKSMPSGWSVSENSNLLFSDDGKRLYFGTAPKPLKEPEDTLLDEEKYKLDIWSWDDDLLQPMQKKQLEQELKRNYQAVYNTSKNMMCQIADTSIPAVRIDTKTTHNYVLGSSNRKYLKSSSWDSRNYSDYFLINIETGLRKRILTKYHGQVILSPSGRYLLAWAPDEKQYHVLLPGGEVLKIIKIPGDLPLYDELNDIPGDPSPYGIAGWTDNDEQVMVYDRYDIWSFRITVMEEPVNITNGFGRSGNIRFRYIKLDPDKEFIPSADPICLSAFNLITREAGFYSVIPYKKDNPVKLIFEKASFSGGVTKAKNSNKIIWQKESFDLSSEIYYSDLYFKNIKRLSVSNRQQKNYNWITAELFTWTSFDRQELQGILYKPEDFDPTKKYPMIVYFYERSSDGLYRYFPPSPSASIINRSFAVSNGYLLFVPDIPYKTGYPGESCYNAVVSGTYALLNKFNFIDKDRLGLDGQSWGGYQIAWLVTRTDLFKCAYAGAPVSNMISAYGGIRWESGMSRMFQYEHSQSRIGGTLWEKPVHFIENSPIFFVPKINTPLLLMHNDSDGAVPWYQGIEFITALRRLGKPAWLLSYNDEAHNLVKRPNRKDLSIRKMQFFDHYLKGADMPYWMKFGISQIQKGKNNGYNLVNE